MAGLYVHIPFCQKRCIYCDFYSTTLLGWKERYVDAVCKELFLRRDYLNGEQIQTLYIGGGTPSQLPVPLLRKVFDCIFRHFPVAEDAEITMEANPDDLSDEYVHQVVERLPVNRLSMGIQTFNDEKLRLLNRRHTAQQAIEAVRRCQQAGIHNISIDLIYGLPNESLEDWESDLQQALALNIQHLSAYHLMYEEGTALWKMRESQDVEEVEEGLSVQFFNSLASTLTINGFEHYEISNFCRPGFHSRHNSSYWHGVPYLGCGASAHSYNEQSRQWNIASLTDYVQGMEEEKPQFEVEQLDRDTRYNEYVMTGLRTAQGISLSSVSERFGLRYHDYLLQQAALPLQQGTLIRRGDRLRLTREGIFISDSIMSDLMFVEG